MSRSDQDEAVAAVERALVAIRRSQTRRSLSRLAPPGGDQPVDPTLFGVLDVVEDRGEPCAVTDVATALGVDQPRASRLVSRAVDQGLLARRADPADARRSALTLTDSGRAVLTRTHQLRQRVFARVMADWSAADRTEFARLITRFVTSFSEVVPGAD
ncbi:MarR family winged helix-turn-helix transcriptional regulator [Goodfellowiella coeruleoviolacea]|uniref:DNA-binding transcriptional regulator, MarR family n=1 Tax=Goodfellowiella coeruleoviolacea TaxID=334858 RepID=A0AAE3GIH0_9PSEU|nr:MarR family transcriptional regulator [Goodfellowiella coeruleoviolacea]MCP2168075.1 DNA-binding transcriptional regulator, MarR family [Goodfellowiella coeruleoviolacea]